MDVTVEIANDRPEPDDPCAHCGLRVGRFPVGTDPYFCCSGCATVFHILSESGLADTFYRLRNSSPSFGDACPAPVKPNTLLLAELDTEEFLAEHTDSLPGGYRSTNLYLDGVHCVACVWLVERMPLDLPGVRTARLDLPRARLTLEWNPEQVSLSAIGTWLVRIGYPVQPRVKSGEDATHSEEKKLLIRVGVCWALAGNVMLIAFALYSGLAGGDETGLFHGARWLSFALTIPAVIFGGGVFFRRAWASLRVAARRRSIRFLHMDMPISLGILVGLIYSAWSLLIGAGDVWFDSITVLIAALLTARWIQLRSRRLAGDEADRLLALIPTMARFVDENGAIRLVRAEGMVKNSVVEVPAGEVIPVDGTVLVGESYLNRSILTGESAPDHIEFGDPVWAGTTNLSETIRIKTTSTGQHTRIGRLLAWVSDEKSQGAPVMHLVDRVGGYFVATVLAAAILSFSFSLESGLSPAVRHVVALLVITCPCALGMATPLALAIGAGRAARRGIFIKQESSFDTMTRIDTVVLDKTGTLTEGRPSVSRFIGDQEALDLAAALERESNHPIALALREKAAQRSDSYRVDDARIHIGLGISGTVDSKQISAGSLDWIRTITSFIPDNILKAEKAFGAEGATPVCITIDSEVRAVVAVSDRIRPDASQLIADLEKRGIKVILSSGDSLETVEYAAFRLGIARENTFGRQSPDDKLELVNSLIGQGYSVAMIGDGVNDAAALQKAHVGIAVSGSSTAGQMAADIFLTGRGIDAVATLFAGSKNVMSVIRRNLFLSLAYNLAGAGLAIAGFVTPLVAAVAMPVSSFTVVLLSIMQTSFNVEPRKQ